MSAFKRLFKTDPGLTELLAIEGVAIIDQSPPNLPTGVGTGTVLMVGEFEDGVFNRPVEILSPKDQLAKLGGFGFTTPANPHSNPVGRKSGGSEFWNGNGYVWMSRKPFNRLIAVRADTSAGKVEFRRLACIKGGKGAFQGVNGDLMTFTLNSGPATVTLDSVAGVVTAIGASYPVAVDGLTLGLSIDRGPKVTIVFSGTLTVIEVRDKINAVTALSIAADASGQIEISSNIRGFNGSIEIVDGTARTLLGLPTAVVQDVDTWTFTAPVTGLYSFNIQVPVNGLITDHIISHTATLGDTSDEFRDSFLAEILGGNIPGLATALPGGGSTIVVTYDDNVAATNVEIANPGSDIAVADTTPPVLTQFLGTGNVGNDQLITATEAASMVTATANLTGSVDSDGLLTVCNSQTPGTGTITALTGPLLAVLGIDVGASASSADGPDIPIAAGTIVRGTNSDWVTAQTVQSGTGGGPITVSVRPLADDDTAIADSASTVTTVVSPEASEFSVTNPLSITRLSAPQIDAAYTAALAATLDLNNVAAQADFVASARSSETIMDALEANAANAGPAGLRPRKACLRPLIGITIEEARGSTGQGVGARRSDQLQYAFPGVTIRMAEIARVGALGGPGFTDDGIIQVGSDSSLLAIESILNPEEDAGQRLADTNVLSLPIVALEDAYNLDKGGASLGLAEYKAFKAAGITAPSITAEFGTGFQSDVTTVNPETDANIAPANRRRMADFINASVQSISAPYVNKMARPFLRRALKSAIDSFLSLLKNENNEAASRILDYSIIITTSVDERKLGLETLDLKVAMHSTLKAIAITTTVGATVEITER